MPRECLAIIVSKSKVRYSRNKPVVTKVSTNTSTSGISLDVSKLKDMVKALLLDKKSQKQAPATVKAVEESCVTCGSAHSYHNCPATDGNVYCDNIQAFVSQASAVNYNKGNTSYRLPMMSNQIRPPGFPPIPKNQNVQLNQRNNQNRFNQNQNWGNNFNQGHVYQPSVFQPSAYQAPAYQAPATQTQGVSKENFLAYVKANDAVMRNMKTQDLLTKFVNSNNASTSSSGTLPSNTIANLRSDLKAITTRSGVSYDGPQIPPSTSFLPKVVENKPESTKDTVHPTNNGSNEDVQPQVVQFKSLILTSEPVNSPTIEQVTSPVSAPRPNLRPSIPYPSRIQDQKLRDKANDQREKFFQIFKDLNFNISFVDALILMPKVGPSIKSLLTNKDKLCELARTPLNEHCSAVLLKNFPEKLGDADKFLIPCDFLRMAEYLALADLGAIINLMPLSVSNKLYIPNLTPTCMNLELADHFDADPRVPLILGRSFLKTVRVLIDVFEDDPTSQKVDQSYLDPEGDILLLEEFLNDDPSLSPPNQGNYLPEVRKELKIREAKSDKSSINEPPEVELKDLPPHLEYKFLKGDETLPIIISKDLSVEEKTALITVLKSHKRAIAWKLSDIKGIDPEFCTHKILMEEDFEPAVQHQRRVNPKIHDVIKQEYPVYQRKGGFTVVENEDNELIPTRLVMGWHVCIDYRKLNEATRKDHFPLPFMDQMLERLTGNQYYCFLDGFSGYFQILIDPKDQEKTTFTCPYGMFAYRRMPFGLCNAPGTFQSFWEFFLKLSLPLERMLKRCEDTNLCLSWEKSHFMVKEDIVLGHKISKQGIKVDKSKVDVITKLPHPTTVTGIRSFLGHASFYRRFIKDFLKIARPMTRLLEKDTPFIFYKECVEAFKTLKRKLTEAPILIAPDWDMPFELMCDASDFAIGAVLGQHKEKHFRPIHYASKIMTEAESNYTTTKKEMLAVVHAFEKFRPYLIMNKSIVYTDHSALKYLFAKKDSKARLL
nr:reverse transcriptase domain-containing protein [Tanacetum cinerariifolium]